MKTMTDTLSKQSQSKRLTAVFGIATLALGLGMQAGPAQAVVVYDANADFTASSTTNPNGVWRYGYDTTASGYDFKPFNDFQVYSGLYPFWTDSGNVVSGTPAFGKNPTGTSISGIGPGQISLHPGAAPFDEAAILRFTAPSNQMYDLIGQFFGGDFPVGFFNGDTDARIIKNGNVSSPLFSIASTAGSPSFSFSALSLVAGDTIDFVVGNLGNFVSDNTPITVQFLDQQSNPVTEPATALLLAAGVLAMRMGRRQRNLTGQ